MQAGPCGLVDAGIVQHPPVSTKCSTGQFVPQEETMSSSSRRSGGQQTQQHGLCGLPAVLVWFRSCYKPFSGFSH